MSMKMSSSENSNGEVTTMSKPFEPLNPDSLVSAPCLIEQTLCCAQADEQPRLAKDFNYASAVLEAWKEQERDDDDVWNVEWNAITYFASNNDEKDTTTVTASPTPLYGHIVRPADVTAQQQDEEQRRPGIVLFHTGAGPHDLFLLWKAASLVHSLKCVVLIADILSDESGWAWSSDRSRYNQARVQVLKETVPADGSRRRRPVLQSHIRAAITTLQRMDEVDSKQLAALGWCLGGQPILELGGRMPDTMNAIRAMVTFHGVFDTSDDVDDDDSVNRQSVSNYVQGNDSGETAESPVRPACEILICNGSQDPFVSDESLEFALETFQQTAGSKNIVSLLQLKEAKHGFTNPAQDFNENPAFAFHAASATKAWRQAVALLKRILNR